jgi:hypothetical protein
MCASGDCTPLQQILFGEYQHTYLGGALDDSNDPNALINVQYKAMLDTYGLGPSRFGHGAQ